MGIILFNEKVNDGDPEVTPEDVIEALLAQPGDLPAQPEEGDRDYQPPLPDWEDDEWEDEA